MPKAMAQRVRKKIDLLEMDVPSLPLGEDQLRVCIHAAALNQADGRVLRRQIPGPMLHSLAKPLVVGYDFAGKVVESRAQDFPPGTMVFGHLAYSTKTRQGTLGEEIVVDADAVAQAPDGIPPVHAAAIATSGLTALQGLEEKGKLRSGQKVLVIGAAGGVGCAAVNIAKQLGAEVLAVCSTYAIDAVKSLGADEVIDRRKQDFREIKHRFDLIFDASGAYGYGDCRHLLKPEGAFVTATPDMKAMTGLLRALFSKHRVAMVFVKSKRPELERLARWMRAGMRIPVAVIFPLREASEALKAAETGGFVGKVAIETEQSVVS